MDISLSNPLTLLKEKAQLLSSMILRTLLFTGFFFIGLSLQGQTINQDTAYWEDFDAGMVDRIWDGLEEQTYRRLFDSLKIEMATRLRNGPVTTSLAYRYHWISLQLKGLFLEEVKPYADTAIMLRIEAGAPTADIAQSHYEKARVLRSLGSDQESLTFFEEGIRIMSQAIAELDSTPNLAKRQAYFLKEAAWSAGLNGNYELARIRLRQVPSILRLDTSSIASKTAYETLIVSGNIEVLAENYAEAIQLYQQALDTDFFRGAGAIFRGSVNNNLGMALLLNGQYAEADQVLGQAVTFFSSTTDWFGLASAYINILHLRVRQRRPEEALALLGVAESTAKKVGGSGKGIIFGELYLYAAQAAEQLGQSQLREQLLAKTATALLMDTTLNEMGQLPRIEGNTIYGQTTLLQFLSVKRDIFLRAYGQTNDLNDLLLAHRSSYTIDSLIRLNRDQLNLTASLGQFITSEAEEYTTAVDIALRLYRKTNNTGYLNEAYQFVAGQKSNLLRRYLTSPGLAGTLGVPENIVEEKKQLELQVLIVEKALQNASGAVESTLRDSLLRLNFQVSRLKEEIAENHPLFSSALRGYTDIDPSVASTTMENNQLLVEYFLSSDSVYIFTLSRQVGLEVLTTARPENMAELIETVVDQGVGSTVLYELLVEPVLTNRPNITRLQFIPDGELWMLPFAALKKGGNFLINDYAISFAYAAPLLFDEQLSNQAKTRELEYLGYGISYKNIQRDLTSGLRSVDFRDLRAMGQLPFASKEVERASGVIGGEYRLDEEASLASFLGEAGGTNILHLSMHGLLRPNPMESALVFSGGRGKQGYALLEMKDVLGGDYPAELTVLSACHTGGGTLQTSEGMQSIGRAFTAAGSRSTITSTWAARDESTYDILGHFFSELQTGVPKDVALQRALNEYLAAGTLADRQPANWANLTLTGIVTPVSKNTPWHLLGLGVFVIAGLFFIVRRLLAAAT